MALAFRPACEADLDRLVEIHTSAFPDPRDEGERRRNFVANPLGTLDDLWVLLEGGEPLAHAFLFALEAWIGGARVRLGGVASVGVAPEARGRGLASALLAHLHEVARARGDAATVLYAYRQGFYARLGYGPTSAYRRLRVHPAAIPWRPELRVRAAAGADREALRACWEAEGLRHTGTLVRTDRAWEARLGDERRTWLIVEGSGGVEGYVAWSLLQHEPHAPTALLVREMASRTPAAARSLWAAIGAQRDQVTEVRADVADDDPVDRVLVDGDRARFGDAELEHALGEVGAGPMLRAPDAARALEARGWAEEGALVVAAGDEHLALTVRDGRASATPTGDEPQLTLAPEAFSAVALGGLRPSHAARLRLAEARDARALALADALFALPAYFSPDPF